jgi:hypothetical protein
VQIPLSCQDFVPPRVATIATGKGIFSAAVKILMENPVDVLRDPQARKMASSLLISNVTCVATVVA